MMRSTAVAIIGTIMLIGCSTSNTEIMNRFKYSSGEEAKIEGDLKACEISAFNAGYTRKGGLVNEGGRVEFLESCLEKKWQKR